VVSHKNTQLHFMIYVCDYLRLNSPVEKASSFYSEALHNDIIRLMTNRKSQR